MAEGEDVVPHGVKVAVVLVEASVPGVVHEVVFHEGVGAAFVIVEAPAAVAMAGDVVDVIASDDGAGGGAEAVVAAHVAEVGPAEVVDVIIFYQGLA